MDPFDDKRIEDVRGEPADELLYITRFILEKLFTGLPREFWRHLRAARREVRMAVVVLLRALADLLEHIDELEDAARRESVSKQRGKINLDISSEPPDSDARPPWEPPTPPPPAAPPPSRQRGKINLD
ncbi:MAG: hypothetical protein U0641_19335 [Anaerolineae bacterium]